MKNLLCFVLFAAGLIFTPARAQVVAVMPYTGPVTFYTDTTLKVLRVNFTPVPGAQYINAYATSYGIVNGDTQTLSSNVFMYIEAQSISGNYWLDWKLPGQLRIPLQEVVTNTNYGWYCETVLGDTLIRSNNFTGLLPLWSIRLEFYDPATHIVYSSPLIPVNVESYDPIQGRTRKKPHPQHPNR